ncbi:MAG: insulinase family protein [Proteobacteria bacterium]|nr:insulinase family protein [Pseudomonadota bacterium]NOG60650.1 insulinase family protein [Pseudomonadota bacterium]
MYYLYTPVLRAKAPRTYKKITIFRRTLFLYISLLLTVSWSAHASPKIETWKTSKGIDVYYVHAPELPMVDMEIVFDAGGSRNGALPGLAALTNGLLSQGAEGLDADAISSGFESLGAIYGSDAGYDSASVSLRSLTDETLLSKALENLKRVVSKPDFPKDALERRRARTLIGLKAKQQSPAALAQDAFMSSIYQSHPYASPNDGTEESIKAIKRNQIIDFYKQYYVASNALVAIVGAVDRKQAEQIAEDITSGLAQGKKAEPLEEVKRLEKADSIFIEHPSAQTHILVGQPGLKRGDPDYFPLYVGNHVLGGGGMVSRLFEEIREKRGLSYSAYSYFSPMRFKGPFLASLQTRSDQVDEALSVLIDNINHYIESGPLEEELIASKKNITGGYPLRIDSNSKILNYVVAIAYYKLPLDYLETFNANVDAVTVEQIKDAFKRRLTPENFVTVMVGSSEEKKEGQ